jgi:hypothetical protein
MREGTQGPPLVNTLNNVVLKFMMHITSYFFLKKITFENGLKTK